MTTHSSDTEMPPELLVAALYRFTDVADVEEMKEWILEAGRQADLCGTILVAPEGINGTIAGLPEKVGAFLEVLESREGLEDLEIRYSRCEKRPFKRWRVRLKNEIVTLGVEGTDPREGVGKYLDPEEWNRLLAEENVTLIDTRNHYETKVGKFKGAIDPDTETFREFPEWVDKNLDPKENAKVAMYCTGGIRCEKATNLLLRRGFREVYHLKGGILRYLEETPQSDSLWDGECFVFDERVSVDQDLKPGKHIICEHCQLPIPAEEMDDHECGKLKRAKMA
ncbi:oxygen-dependent tRNA uridine(34) hydroxylase TrhO [Puniceicoccus vermicola]|uniref:tRNA uridine(34) hydroxylase n=1 Tax=Puniceicoccus vermicola TaxID=388746 RepID=A0A7X1AWV8_9BACT|nr:rhodanese-related sulfurtransferase [Puniceicoccus vermicola]MBC2601364.1 rhodanese-related sulfurtransferase [Puniceicoccus vermicola]